MQYISQTFSEQQLYYRAPAIVCRRSILKYQCIAHQAAKASNKYIRIINKTLFKSSQRIFLNSPGAVFFFTNCQHSGYENPIWYIRYMLANTHDVVTASCDVVRRRIDVETTLCVYRGVFSSKQRLRSTLYTQLLENTSGFRIFIHPDPNWAEKRHCPKLTCSFFWYFCLKAQLGKSLKLLEPTFGGKDSHMCNLGEIWLHWA